MLALYYLLDRIIIGRIIIEYVKILDYNRKVDAYNKCLEKEL